MSDFDVLAAQTMRTAYETFGETVIFTPRVGSPVSLTGIWDQSVEAREGQEWSGKLFILMTDIAPLVPLLKDRVSIGGAMYSVEQEPRIGYDGNGGVNLALRKVTGI
jgi:hypothetical protein